MPDLTRDGFWGYQPTPEATLGQAIYHAALAGRPAYDPDNGWFCSCPDAEWTAVFTAIGNAARNAK